MDDTFARQQLSSFIKELGLSHLEATILDLVKPSILIQTKPVRALDSLILGASRLGGVPDLPDNISWPEWNGRGLEFIFQLNLGDLAEFEEKKFLPESGILYFFYDSKQWVEGKPYEDGRYRVIYYNGSLAALKRATKPFKIECIYNACSVSFVRQPINLPPFDSYQVEVTLGMSNDTLGHPDTDAFVELCTRISKSQLAKTFSWLFGYPDQVQGDIFCEAEEAVRNLEPGACDYKAWSQDILDWRLLLQIGADDNAEMMWGDAGTLYFCLKGTALQGKKFNEAVVIMQSG